MSSSRFSAVQTASQRPVIAVESLQKRSEHFGSQVFSFETMRKYVPSSAVQEVVDVINNRKKITQSTAGLISLGMKEWAISKGVNIIHIGFSL